MSNSLQPLNTTVIACVAIILLTMLLASIHPLDWSSYLLHQIGTVIFMGVMLWCYRHLNVTAKSFAMATLFLLIHILGARYLYSYVPYNDWTQAILGFSLNEVMGWQRNMYDRLVHFSYGLLLFAMMRDYFRATFSHSRPGQLICLVLGFNLASSALYELFEWGIAMTLSAEDAEAYNGQQGDIWDAHHDMALALLGGVIGGLLYRVPPHQTAIKD